MRTLNSSVCEAGCNSRLLRSMSVFFPHGNSFLWQMTQKTNSDYLWEEMNHSKQEYFTQFTKVAKPKELVPRIFFSNIWSKFREKNDSPHSCSIRFYGKRVGGCGGDCWHNKDSYLLLAFVRYPKISLSCSSVQPGKFILPTTATFGEKKYFPTFQGSSSWSKN